MKDLSDYDPWFCDGHPCPGDCTHCSVRAEMRQAVDTVLYEEVERHDNCTVQVLKNTVTGELSVGWWVNEVIESQNDGLDSQNDYIE